MDARVNNRKHKEFIRKPTEDEKELLQNATIPKEMVRIFPRIINPKKSYKGVKKYGIISYVLIPEKMRAKPDMEGLFMLRPGRYNTPEEAQAEAEKMIRERDSLNVYYVVQEEESTILSSNPKYSLRDYKVNIERTKGEAAETFKEGEIDPVTQAILDGQMADMMESKEIAEKMTKHDEEEEERQQYERIQRMRKDADLVQTRGTLEYYTMLRSKHSNLLINAKKIHDRLPLMEKLIRHAHEIIAEIKAQDELYPHYKNQWRVKELEAIRETGGISNVDDINPELLTPEEYFEKGEISIRQKPAEAGTSQEKPLVVRVDELLGQQTE